MTAKPMDPAQRKRKTDIGVVAALAALGASQRQIGEVTEKKQQTVSEMLNHPETKARVLELRERLKLLKMQRAAATEGRLWDLLDKKIASGEAKEVDATARALLASEKIQGLAAGEAQRIEVKDTNPVVDLKVLIQQLLMPAPALSASVTVSDTREELSPRFIASGADKNEATDAAFVVCAP